MKKTKITRVAVDRLRLNEGQLPWLPKNPRSWTQTDIDRMVKSVEEDPDFADVRPVLAVPGPDGTFVVFAHNLLTKAAMVRGDRTLPTVVYEPETEEDQETIRRLALKDNGSFGSWDTDILANEWNTEPWQLEDWGVPEWITGGAAKGADPKEGSSAPAAKEGKTADLVDLKIPLAPEEFAFVKRTLGETADSDRDALLLLLGYDPDGEAGEL